MKEASGKAGKPCRMCGKEVTAGRGRSKEHVLPAWIQREFKLAKRTVSYTPLEADAVPAPLQLSKPNVDTPWRSHSFGTLLLGSVCKSCNDGWMSALEGRAQPDLIHLMRGTGQSVADPDGVALWALKTAFTLTLATDPPIGRVPQSHGTYAAHFASGLPAGVNVLLHRSDHEGWWFSSVSTFAIEVKGGVDKAQAGLAAHGHQRNAYCYFLHLGRVLLVIRYWPDNRSTLVYDGARFELLSAGSKVIDEEIDLPDLDYPLMDLVMSMRVAMDLDDRAPDDFCICGSGVPTPACAALQHTPNLPGNWGWLND